MTTPHEPPGLRFYDGASQRDMLLVYAPHEWAGWLCYRHPDGQWVSLRKATEDDQSRINRAVVEAHHADD